MNLQKLWKPASGKRAEIKTNPRDFAGIKRRIVMRELFNGNRKYTRVLVTDQPGAGGACHEYRITYASGDQNPPFALIKFQKGPIKEAGLNGCFQEDLIAVVIDRLQSFQKGDFACRENEIALTKLEEALMWLNKRTSDREARGVEGTSEK